jgi:hypothetical protein
MPRRVTGGAAVSLFVLAQAGARRPAPGLQQHLHALLAAKWALLFNGGLLTPDIATLSLAGTVPTKEDQRWRGSSRCRDVGVIGSYDAARGATWYVIAGGIPRPG